MEVWKDVRGYEGLYEVSNFGNVRSLNWRNEGIVRNLYLKRHNRGYLQVELANGNKKQMFLVHRLVAQAFIPNPYALPQINHIDEDKHNNSADNLEWCTQSQNMKAFQKTHNGCRAVKPRGNSKQSLRNKYKIQQLTIDGKLVNTWDFAFEAKRKFNYNTTSIWECCEGKRKSAYGYKWQYAISK